MGLDHGTAIVLVWRSSNGPDGPAGYSPQCADMQRQFAECKISVPAKLKGRGDLWIVGALAPDAQTIAVGLFDQHGDQSLMRVVVLDITQDKGPIIYTITGIQDVSVPELSFSLSGKFLAITLEPEWNGDEDSTGPGLAYVLEAAKLYRVAQASQLRQDRPVVLS